MGRRADAGKRREWVERLRRHEKSGQTVAEFCEWEGVSAAAFYNWRKKLTGGNFTSRSLACTTTVMAGRPEPESRLDRTAFLPVRVTPQSGATADPSRIEIRLANGVCIFVPDAEVGTLETVIAAVGRLSFRLGREASEYDEFAEDVAC
jgi:transposase-like protein